MPGGIFLLDPAGELTEMSETATYFRENRAELDLQKLLARHPDLLAGDQIDPGTPRRWLLVSREVGIPDQEQGGARWSLDHLFLDPDGVPPWSRSSEAAIPGPGAKSSARCSTTPRIQSSTGRRTPSRAGRRGS